MHDRGPPREQKLMRPPVPQLPVSTRENLVKKFFRAAHKLPCGSSMQRECRNMPLNQSIRRSAAAILCRGGQQRFAGPKMLESSWRSYCLDKVETCLWELIRTLLLTIRVGRPHPPFCRRRHRTRQPPRSDAESTHVSCFRLLHVISNLASSFVPCPNSVVAWGHHSVCNR